MPKLSEGRHWIVFSQRDVKLSLGRLVGSDVFALAGDYAQYGDPVTPVWIASFVPQSILQSIETSSYAYLQGFGRSPAAM
jgi:hypothetical protein